MSRALKRLRPLLTRVDAPETIGAPLSEEEIDRLARQRAQKLADKFAREDEEFRRDLLATLRSIGRGKPGAVSPHGKTNERLLLLFFEAERSRLAYDGERPSEIAAARRLTTPGGPYHGIKPVALLFRLKRARARKK